MNSEICKIAGLLRFEILQTHLGKRTEGPISFLKQEIEGGFGQGSVVTTASLLITTAAAWMFHCWQSYRYWITFSQQKKSKEQPEKGFSLLLSSFGKNLVENSRASDLPQGIDAWEVSSIAPIRESCCYQLAQMAVKKTDRPALNVIERRFAQSPTKFLFPSVFFDLLSMLNKSWIRETFHLECELLWIVVNNI